MLGDGDTFWTFLSSIPWWAWFPILAIVGGVVQTIVRSSQRHKERMAMIQRGMHPDGRTPS